MENSGPLGVIGSYYIIKQGGVFEKGGKIHIIYPEYIELRDAKW